MKVIHDLPYRLTKGIRTKAEMANGMVLGVTPLSTYLSERSAIWKSQNGVAESAREPIARDYRRSEAYQA